ncbi:hypothetical protein C8R44DRAFT_822740 [Mycena epipterygia]|nr:hypothetical protein C8R44DRAFT_822740 [Mycena epipterygia]
MRRLGRRPMTWVCICPFVDLVPPPAQHFYTYAGHICVGPPTYLAHTSDVLPTGDVCMSAPTGIRMILRRNVVRSRQCELWSINHLHMPSA